MVCTGGPLYIKFMAGNEVSDLRRIYRGKSNTGKDGAYSDFQCSLHHNTGESLWMHTCMCQEGES